MASNTSNSPSMFKIVTLGESRVGKTSIVLRYCQNKFNQSHLSTEQAAYQEKKLNIGGKTVKLVIWDTAGQEEYSALGPIYYRDSDGAILVYDITDQNSFKKMQNWVTQLRKMLGREICLCIVGNKIDLEKERKVSKSEAEDYASYAGAVHCDTSAKGNKGIEEMFLNLTKRIITTNAGDKQQRRHRGVEIIADQPEQQKSSCC